MAPAPRACIKTIRLCLLAGQAHGIDAQQVLRAHGLDAALLSDPYARVSHTLVTQLWEDVPARAGDDAFGLHAAEQWHAQNHDAIDGALGHCQTLGEMFQLLSRYVRLMHDSAAVSIEREGQRVRLAERWLPPAVIPRHFGELVMAMWVLRCRRLGGEGFQLREVGFAHPRPANLDEHRRLFGVPLRFSAAEYSITLDATTLDAKIASAEPLLGLVLQRHLQDELSRLPPRDDFLLSAKRAAQQLLRDPKIDLGGMARRLHVSERTLQRRLQQCETSFQALLEAARRDEALRLLGDERLALTEVAWMTGYADMSTFYRAFRRWTGKTPGDYRRDLLG